MVLNLYAIKSYMNTIKNILFSNRLTGVLFIAFALAMAIGTFMDAGQDTSPTPLTRNLIYNAWWFEGIMLLFVINFIGNIFKYNLLNKRKWPVLLLHLSWIFILVGAFVTRYISYEGVMSIREGATENSFLSEKTYLTVYIDGDYEIDGLPQRWYTERPVDFSPRMENKFGFNAQYADKPISIKLTEFINGAEEDVVYDENGEYYLKIVESAGGMPHNHFLKEGSTENIHGTLYTLNNYIEGAVNITFDDDNEDLYISSPYEGEYMVMATMSQGALNKDTYEPLNLRARYIINNQQLVFPKPVIKGFFDIVKKSELLKSDQDGLELLITTPAETKTVRVIGGKGTNNAFKTFRVGEQDFMIRYGSKVYDLPFSVKLNDFIAEKYPGTDKSYSSFASEVTVIGEENFDYKIYMNNILNYKGYRFFQASFDPDEKGTILSVNHDSLGTFLTYLGYILLYLGLVVILFASFTRFDFLKKQLDVARKNKVKVLTSLLILFTISSNSQSFGVHNHSSKPEIEIIDSILSKNIASKEQAEKFGRLVIQDLGGRMMPMNTYSSELIRKLSKKDHYKEFDSNQVFLSMQESPLLWYSVPLIFLKSKKGDSIRSIIGVSKESKHVSLADFFTMRGDYKLAPYLEEAYRAAIPNGFQKEFKETDQRVNLLYNSLEGTTINIFPIPNDENNKWIAPSKTKFNEVTLIDSLYSNFINTGFKTYLYFLNEGKISGNYDDADDILSAITNTQLKYGSDVMLSKNKINAELLYNKYDIFKSLFSWYLYASTVLFIALIIQIFNRNKFINSIVSISKYATYLLFIIHALGLIARWYISGHAPWSDGYESMIYVAWATMLFGIYFGRKSDLALASTTFVTSMILMIAHWSWMDPAIANLVPVLDSYWLMIHVAVIVGSYGPFTISMILGIVSLILMILVNKRNKEILGINIRELILINEMSMTIGLVMLTIGNFLGGMWANESWGRYWGWDPKETWALISIIIYAFVLHMRLIPGLKSNFAFTVASILSFGSIIMTYFGVNFYLAGLHSYAKDDQEISLVFIGISLGLIFILSLLAFPKYRKYIKNNR